MAANEVRIIGGKWKGRKLRFTPERNLRPSLGRVRETLANWLRGDFPGTQCLDLFAGTGALGLEALSQGAQAVTFVERSAQAAASLRDSLALIEATGHVHNTTAERFLRTNKASFDLIFLDPPFADQRLPALLELMLSSHHLAPQGKLYYELPRREQLDPAGWEQLKHATAGETQFGLLARATPQSVPSPSD